VEEREDDVECKKWVLRVLRGDDHCTWSKRLIKPTLYKCSLLQVVKMKEQRINAILFDDV
jgi:hypothetical protein